ncbi:MAG TPA: hypothetical protein DCX07_13675 [Phycisphaerales bacterium]|nr:hypothetical protein [Phycisphaerales bacterium]
MSFDPPNGPEVDAYTRGIECYRNGQYDRAQAELSSLRDSGGILGRLGRFYYAMSHRLLGTEDLRAGRYDAAEGHFRTALEVVGPQGDLASYLAAIYARTGRADRCADAMERIADAQPDNPSLVRKLAQAQWRAGRRQQAYLTLSAALRRNPATGELLMQKGLFLAAEDRYAEARAALAAAVEADCANPDAHYYLALAAAAEGNPQAAVRSFQRAFDLRPGDCRIAYQLALAAKACKQQGVHVVLRLPEPRVQSAGSQVRQLARYCAAESDFVEAFLSLPDSQADGELFGMLVGVLQMALTEHPDYADLHYHCARGLLRLGRTAAAGEHARRAVEINPKYVKALVLLAKLCDREQRSDEAIAHLEQAIACGGDWPDVHCQAGELLGRHDRREAARRHLERALQLNHRYMRAAEQLRLLAA